ncbi:MAG: helix-turn-helix transcriptional regulator [Acidobacteria bacterium]|nr:helix-turn-helix transcriptional regulator [Acidobacteriota bacterium]
MMQEIHRIVSRAQFAVRHTAALHCEFAAHSHTSYTVTAVLGGSLFTTIGASDYQVSEGHIALTNIGENHAAVVAEGEFLSVSITPIFVDEMVSEIGLTRTAAEIVFRASVVKDEVITATARLLASEIGQEKLGHTQMLEALVRQLVIHLLRRHLTVRKASQIELSRAGFVDRRLRRAIEFMHDNFGRELALAEIAAAAYLSEFHFARLFKQITGLTPHVYLANLRLERARKLLTETPIPIIEIAAMVGYQSHSHFTKIFKSVTGLTPRAYRDSQSSLARLCTS